MFPLIYLRNLKKPSFQIKIYVEGARWQGKRRSASTAKAMKPHSCLTVLKPLIKSERADRPRQPREGCSVGVWSREGGFRQVAHVAVFAFRCYNKSRHGQYFMAKNQ